MVGKKRIKHIADDVIHNDNFIFSFIRSAMSSQAASWVDMIIGFVLFAWLGLKPWVATAIGAVCGGIINCIINFKFTFHAQGMSWKAVALKYIMVWIGSVLLNSFGTEGLYYLFNHWSWLETIGFKPDGYYAAARIITSLLVSWFWNFILQRYFVYRVTKFDPYAINFVNKISFQDKKIKQ